jgi:acetyl-CoA carboxylase carboxyltransferase component
MKNTFAEDYAAYKSIEAAYDAAELKEDKAGKEKEIAAKIDELQGSALAAAKRGYVDDIIEPDATRKRVIAAFEMLSTKQEEGPAKKHASL